MLSQMSIGGGGGQGDILTSILGEEAVPIMLWSIGGGGQVDMLTIILGEEAGPLTLWRTGNIKRMLEMKREDPHVLT